MAKIYLNIEAESVSDLMETVGEFVSNPTPVLEKAVDEVAEKKQQQKKTTKAKKEQTEEKAASMEKTSEGKASSTKKVDKKAETASVDPEPEEETSATAGKYPDATEADVRKAMHENLKTHRAEMKAAFERQNVASIGKLVELQKTKKDAFSVYLTDLEALIETAGD